MDDTGHGKLDFDNFREFEKFYLWKIDESSSESEQDITMEPETDGNS